MAVTFCSRASVYVATGAFPLSAGRILMLISFLSSASACLSLLDIFDFGKVAIFQITANCDLTCSDLFTGSERIRPF